MKVFPVGAVVLWIAVIATGLVLAMQHSRSKTLHAREAFALEATASRLPSTLASATPSAEAVAVSTSEPLTPDEKLELMQLRDRVSSLRERQRSGPGVSNENAQLRTQLASFGSAAQGTLPPGYLRRVDARNVGAATPEAAMESFLWAIRHRDVDAVLGAIVFREVQLGNFLRQQLESGADNDFTRTIEGALPGFRVAGKQELEPDRVRLDLDLGPGVKRTEEVHFRRVDGDWRLEKLGDFMVF